MTDTCPKCLRPVRLNAQYCGFCGASLAIQSEAVPFFPVESPVAEEQVKAKKQARPAKPVNPESSRSNSAITTLAIILLALIIVGAIVTQYWAQILPWMARVISFVTGN